MLYPTQHHSFLLHFTPSSSSLSAPRPLILPPTSLSPQVVEMELGFGASAAAKGGGDDGAAESDFFVDDLLDFSNASLIEDPEEEDLCVKESPAAVAVAADAAPAAATVAVATPKDEFGGLSVPADDMESLEWLSQFVDDSFSEYSLTCPLTKLPPAAAKSRPLESEMVMVAVKPAGPTPVQTKARTKRARTGGRVWSLGSPSLTETSTSSTSSSSTTTSTCSPLSLLLYPPTVGNYYAQQTAESLGVKLPAKRKSRKKAEGGPAVVDGGAPQHSRRCTHCGVQKTPQWRSGPMGSKTLCNACGVRYKSGRLLPEYRPACSPTYSEQLHSNNHRKVMEMRRKKDGETAPGPLVQSF